MRRNWWAKSAEQSKPIDRSESEGKGREGTRTWMRPWPAIGSLVSSSPRVTALRSAHGTRCENIQRFMQKIWSAPLSTMKCEAVGRKEESESFRRR